MAKFAVINGDTVVEVIVANSKEDAELATDATCVEYDDNNPAGIGWTYDGTGFIPRQPFSSWVFNTSTYKWEAPVQKPEDDKIYHWDESTLSWIKVTE